MAYDTLLGIILILLWPGVNVKTRPPFSYDPRQLSRELKDAYIGASAVEIQSMLKSVGAKSLSELYQHILPDVKFSKAPDIGPALDYEQLADHLSSIAEKNRCKKSFIGSGLPHYKQQSIVEFACSLRGLTTAYTPYQPERSQGTLTSLMIYQSALSELTGFEAINASLYDRATCLYEALQTALRLQGGNARKVIVSSTLYPADREVLETLRRETDLEIITGPMNPSTGQICLEKLKQLIETNKSDLAAVAFPQVNQFGILEDVNELTDLCHIHGISSIGVVDPMLLGPTGLKAPARWGKNHQGCTMIVGEGQHLALAPNFGGPGLGIFGIRYNAQNKNAIRATAGRFVGIGKDRNKVPSLCMVLSTREQHIRREKATSNICSNQSFVATIAGAAILERGAKGLQKINDHSHRLATIFVSELSKKSNARPAFNAAFFNEVVLELPNTVSAKNVIDEGRAQGLHAGVDVSARIEGSKGQHLMLFFSDIHGENDVEKLINVIAKLAPGKNTVKLEPISPELVRETPLNIKDFSPEELKTFYQKLADQNVSPDAGVYPLGSCTMKYNPYINDWAASLPGFTDLHPEAPLEDAQGCLEIIYETQQLFSAITGLAGLTSQPVAGAQGELVGLKMFQAYHRLRGEGDKRRLILIPRSAHGTNPATAAVAGFESKEENGFVYGIITIEAKENGEMDFEQLASVVKQHGPRIAGIMVTNPNTAGIFETRFKDMADLIHSVGGLVYMDGANMNAIAGWVNLGALGVDAVHNNQHKTWSIPHGGGGPGDAIVAVSEKLMDFLPGIQVKKNAQGKFETFKAKHSIGSVHRHFGNFAHKVRAYTYVKRLGSEGVCQMSAVAVLSARYLYERLKKTYLTLPRGGDETPRMHEFILTLSDDDFKKLEAKGTPKAQAMAKIGKLFLDFGLHAPTVAFPEVYGLMVEPTESYTQGELDHFASVVEMIAKLLRQNGEVLISAPHFTPVDKLDEVGANTQLQLTTTLMSLPEVRGNRLHPRELVHMAPADVAAKIIRAHADAL